MKKLNLVFLASIILVLVGFSDIAAQISTPTASPRCNFTQEIGFGKITVDYSRPSMKGRVIFGELLPYDVMWRTGANQSTMLTFTEDIFINDTKLKKGSYSLFTIPNKKEWTIILNSDLTLRGTRGYMKEKDVVRFKVPVKLLPTHVETFTIEVGDLTSNTASIFLRWENTEAGFKIRTTTDEQILVQINEQLANPMESVANTYTFAANYYLETHRDLDKAMVWVDKAIEIMGENGHNLLLKAKIYAEQDQYAKAIKYAKKSLALAEIEKDTSLIEMDKFYLNKWKSISKNI